MTAPPKTETRSALVALPAEIDITNARDVRRQITAAVLRPGVRVVTVDMTATTFCDSMGFRALLQSHQQATRHGAELRVVNPGPDVRRVLNLTGLDRVLTIYDSFDEAAR